MAYAHSVALTVGASGGFTDYPVLRSVTDINYALVAHGGQLLNASGFDLAFFSDAALTVQLPHEIELHNTTTGEIVMWVGLTTPHTTYYQAWGDVGKTVSQANPTAVWPSPYVAVYHLNDNAASATVLDSTANVNNGTFTSVNAGVDTPVNTSTVTATGSIVRALTFTPAYPAAPRIITSQLIPFSSGYTIEARIKITAYNSSTLLGGFHQISTIASSETVVAPNAYTFGVDYQGHLVARSENGSDGSITGTTVLALATWYNVTLVCNGAGFGWIYIGKTLEATGPLGDSFGTAPGFPCIGGQGHSDLMSFNGLIDEVRFSTSAYTPYVPPPVPTDNPCRVSEPIFWAAIRPSGDLGDVYQGSMSGPRDPGTYYGGYKAPNISSIGRLTREASDWFTGRLPAQSISVVWSDLNHFVRNIFSSVRGSWHMSEIWVYLIDNLTRLTLGTPLLLFYGKIKGDAPSANLTYTTPAVDAFGQTYNILGDDLLIPQRLVSSSDFPGVPPANAYDMGVPIAFGANTSLSDALGALKLMDMGDFTCQDAVVRRCLLIAGNACTGITVYQNGAAIPGGDYGRTVWAFGHTDWTSIVPSNSCVVEINNSWYSLVFLMGSNAAAYDKDSAACFTGTLASGASKTVFTLGAGEGANFIAGDAIAVNRAATQSDEVRVISTVVGDTITLEKDLGDIPAAADTVRSAFVLATNQTPFVYVDFTGFDLTGDGTAAPITSMILQDRHLIENFYLGNWRKGAWLGSPTFEDYPGGSTIELLDRSSWDTAETVATTYLATGFIGAGVIGAHGKRRNLQTVMAEHALSGNFSRGTRGDNRHFIKMLDRDRTRFLGTHTTAFTAKIHILAAPATVPTAKPEWLFNDYAYQFAESYRDDDMGQWQGFGQQGNAPSVVLNGIITKRDVFPMTRDQATADAVAGQRQDLAADVPMIWTIPMSLCGLSIDVLDGIIVTSYEGTGSDGWVEQALWVRSQTADSDKCSTILTAMDVERLLT